MQISFHIFCFERVAAFLYIGNCLCYHNHHFSSLHKSSFLEGMASFITALRDKVRPSSAEKALSESPSSPTEKGVYITEEPEDDTASSTGFIPKDAQAGELSLDETASGGLGRHLGLFSTTFLMYVLPRGMNKPFRNLCLLVVEVLGASSEPVSSQLLQASPNQLAPLAPP
jgi:hypothetical protein